MNWWFLKRKIHTVWYLLYVCVGFLVGIFLSNFYKFSADLSITLTMLSFLILGVYLNKRFIYIIPVVVFCGFILGLSRGQIFQDQLRCADSFKGKNVFIKAKMNEDFSNLDNSFQVKSVSINNKKCSVNLFVNFRDGALELYKGSTIIFRGTLSDGFGSFKAVVKNSKNLKLISQQKNNIILDFKNKFSKNVRKFLPEPHSSMGLGYLIGKQSDLPINLTLSLQTVGLTHIIVASGYNLSIIVRASKRLFSRISKYLSFLSSLTLIIIFIIIAGLSPSVLRASLVSVMSLVAWYYGRRFHPIALIIFVMTITIFINPNFLVNDIGWQLSFSAFIGVMVLAPFLVKYLFGEQKINTIFQILIETFSAQILTLPIIIINFGQLSNIAIIANLLILPLIPIVMALVFLLGFAGFFGPIAGAVMALPTKTLIDYIIKVANILSDLPWASQSISISLHQSVFFYLFILIFTTYLWSVTRYKLRNVNLIE